MLFNSFDFLIFFIIVTLSYFMLPHKYRWSLLLLASCFFYMWFKPEYILILFFTIIVDYSAGIYIENSIDPGRKKLFLIASIIVNVGFLCIFKYYNFINDNITGLANLFGSQNPLPYLGIILPIGLSFHTFQAMSYTIEVYRGVQKAERHFGIYSLYVMFYPQLVAGPIERPQNLIHQFYEKHYFDYERITSGLKLMGWGLFKKIVIADRLSILVNHVYDHSESYPGMTLILATVFFAFQIYCDFSGYTDIALGTARIMGFKLMLNFNTPYFSKSISEFWSRWHISLSTWFRDYVYIPLGGSRVSKWRWYYNLLIVFLISGFWHGANWTYIVWGGLNGLLLVLEFATKKFRSTLTFVNSIPKIIRVSLSVLYTFSLTCLAWIFFRAVDIKAAVVITGRIFKDLYHIFDFKYIRLCIDQIPEYPKVEFYFGMLMIMVLLFADYYKKGIMRFVKHSPSIARYAMYVLFITSIIILGKFPDDSTFIYFQF